MNTLLRNLGFGLMAVGILLLLFWAIEPLRVVWPWLLKLPLLLRIGVVAGTLGFLVLLSTLVAERIREREADSQLRDEF